MITLEQLKNSAVSLLDAQAEMQRVIEVLKEATERTRILREETIPNAMQELGIQSLTLSSGQILTIKQEVYASIPKANEYEAFQWLNNNGFGGLIKTEVKTSYGKGEHDIAASLYQELIDRGLDAKFKEGVHHSTLKAWLKEQLSEGNNVPMDLFGARPVMTARIK